MVELLALFVPAALATFTRRARNTAVVRRYRSQDVFEQPEVRAVARATIYALTNTNVTKTNVS